jgi:hypothetical protein
MKELTEPIRFFHGVLWPNPDEHPGRAWPLVEPSPLASAVPELQRFALNHQSTNLDNRQ